MRKIIVSNMMTIDGFIGGDNGEIDWFVTGEDFFNGMQDVFKRVGMILYGRVTYEGMASFWTGPDAHTADAAIVTFMNGTPKVVFSRTLTETTWENAQLAKGEIGEVVSKLKQEPGKDMIIYGSSTIVSQLAQLGLIDEYWLFINPVILGSGRPEFAGITRRITLKLIGTKVLMCGTVQLIYEPG